MKPILFNTQMVRAILDGKKTATRRLPRSEIVDKWCEYDEYVSAVAPPGSVRLTEAEFYENHMPYKVGDVLYVRETWNGLRTGNEKFGFHTEYWYKADQDDSSYNPDDRWRPSIHMPKDAARIFLKVKAVRVERLQDCGNMQAKDEGFNNCTQFARLWDTTAKEWWGKWLANPLVYVIEFERISKEYINEYYNSCCKKTNAIN